MALSEARGLYCAPGDFYIDPVRPVARAVITHGHADHARAGHGGVLATPETLEIMEERYGLTSPARQPAAYGDSVTRDEVEVILVPAGHVLGSAQAVVRLEGLTMVVSGDYKRRRDPTCPPFEPVPCDVFISEATFGLPVFRIPDDRDEIATLLHSVAQFPERSHIVGAYALGKAQRIIRCCARPATTRPSTSTARCCGSTRSTNPRDRPRPARARGRTGPKKDFAGKIIVAPPSALQDRWSRRFPDPVGAFASGWMRVRARARQRGVELPLIISDHADWDELTRTVDEIRPGQLWITHGREEALVHYARSIGIDAEALHLMCGVMLAGFGSGEALYLQFKEATRSVLEAQAGSSPFRHHGERVVRGQRLLQAASDILLGYGDGPTGRHIYVRQLRDAKVKPQLETMTPKHFRRYAEACGEVLARAHARTADAIVLSAYLGKSTVLDEAIGAFAHAYAKQTELDHAALQQAIKAGRLPDAARILRVFPGLAAHLRHPHYPPDMIDPFGRPISYLRVSVTDRCDLRCVYCMAEHMTFLPKAEVLTLEELDRIASPSSAWACGSCA